MKKTTATGIIVQEQKSFDFINKQKINSVIIHVRFVEQDDSFIYVLSSLTMHSCQNKQF